MSVPAPDELIQDVLRWNASMRPEAPFYVFAGPEGSEDIVTITHLEFTRAAHRAARIFRPRHDSEGEDGQVVAVIALSDSVLYQAVVAGLIAANMVPFPISPRNSPAAVVNLLRKTSCHRLLTTRITLDPLLRQVADELGPEYGLAVEEIPSLAQIFPNLGKESAEAAFEEYPLTARRPAPGDVCLYLHSSGSTGMPKAIPETHRGLMQWTRLGTGADIRDYVPHPIAAMPIPTFHMGGLFVQLLNPIYNGAAVALYPPIATTPEALPVFPTPQSILEHTKRTKCRSMITVPALLTGLAHSPEAVELLGSLGYVAYSGGSLPDILGKDLVKAGVKLNNLYGGTEFGAVSYGRPLPGDEYEWEYCRFVDGVNVQWDPQGDGTFECQFLQSDRHTVSIDNMEGVRGYATSDLWMPHPQKPYLWKMVGRIDDVIVHSSGEKTVPAPMEDIISGSPLVSGVVMFGWKRDETGIVIEPVPSAQIDVNDAEAVTALRNKLWPIIEQANQNAPNFSRIFKEMILFTPAEKPLPRTGKRTVMRKLALQLYADEIDALYKLVGEKSVNVKLPAAWDEAAVNVWLTELVCELLELKQISPEVDLFNQGFDSLSATFLRIRIVAAMRSLPNAKNALDINQNLVYTYPTISSLATFLAGLASGSNNAVVDPQELVDSLIAKYSSDFAAAMSAIPRAGGSKEVVLVTGTTGNLGSELLASLLHDDRVEKVYAFNRPGGDTSASERQRLRFVQRGLDEKLLESSKLAFVDGTLDKESLGLEAKRYAELRHSVTLIIHNAWKLDFNLSVASFEPHIHGTRKLADLALSSPQRPRIVFTSSVASAMNWDPSKGPCPEELIGTEGVSAGSTGYGQSKLVAEQVLARSGLSVSALRIGQVCGSLPNGAWAVSDWVPILVKTSVTLGVLPTAPGLVSWIDFNTVTKGVLDVAFSHDGDASTRMFNAVHPRPVSWDFVITSLRDELAKQKDAKLVLVAFADWLARLEAAATNPKADSLPGLKLLDFFRFLSSAAGTSSPESEFGGISFATEKLQGVSGAVKVAEPISVEQVGAWVRYWDGAGLF
ncbi:General substrate transporter [Mycena chlorophos]|uniref:General substrate transporter n=1 Tax=Mycena chlorophos TaxID=658473 RepID=A0A8H6TSW2_MYCCL|nr:General substrate transporter [Mycena chlorophos]